MKVYALACVALALLAQGLFLLFLLGRLPGLPLDLGTLGALTVNGLLLAQFGLGHSLMARPRFKAWWTARIPPAVERSTYLLVSALSLGLLLLVWQPLPGLLWQLNSPALQGLFHLGLAAGLGLLVWAILSLDPWGFHGLRQVFQPGQGDPPFSLRGPYRHVRHPIQSGLMLALWSTPVLSSDRLLFNLVLTLYSVAATLALEERDLRAALGEVYDDYRRRVGAFLPRWGGGDADS